MSLNMTIQWISTFHQNFNYVISLAALASYIRNSTYIVKLLALQITTLC